MSLITNDTTLQGGFPFAVDRSDAVIENVEFRHANAHVIDNNRDMLKTTFGNREKVQDVHAITAKEIQDKHLDTIKENYRFRLDASKESDRLSKEMALGFSEMRNVHLRESLDVSRAEAISFKQQSTLDAILKAVGAIVIPPTV